MAGVEDGVAANSLVDRTSDLGSRIRVSLDFLCKNSTNLQEILVHLLSNNVISQHESEVVESEKSSYGRFRQLFTVLIPKLRHGKNSRHFVNAFQQSGNEHILEELKNAVVTTDFAQLSLDTSSLSVRFNVREPVSSFVGRENFLLDLDQQILRSQRTGVDIPTTSTIISRICVVTGLGGIGKTETIRKYILSYDHCYQHVVWIDAEEHNTAENQFRRLALHELKLPSKDIENNAKDLEALVKDVYDFLCTKPTLIVLDNAEAFYDTDPQRPGVDRFLPKFLRSTFIKPVVIITTRHQDWLDLHSTPLPLLTPKESSAFLFHQLKLEVTEANEKDATKLSETFGGLPLALQAAAAVILQEFKRNKLMGKDVYTIQHLLSDYNEGKREVLKNRPPGSPDATPLMFLWKVSLDKIRQQPHGHLATQILNVMAHLSPTNIPKELLIFIFNSEHSDSLVDALELLVDYSFVHDFQKHFSIHRVLQDVTLAHLRAPMEASLTAEDALLSTPPLIRITTALKKYWPTVPKSSKSYDAVHDNLIHVTMSHVLPNAENPAETNLYFINFIVFVLEQIKNTRWVEAENCCRVLIAYFIASALPSQSASHFKSSQSKNLRIIRLQLAQILGEMGRYKEAVGICQESLSSLNSLENQEDFMPEILDTKINLASILLSQGEYEEAIKLYSSVIDLLSKLHGPTHKFTLATKNNLALALKKSGRLSEAKTAKTLYEEILEVKMKDLGPLHPSTLATKHNMSTILEEEGRYDDALEMLREVVEETEIELGPLHADTLISNTCMANVLEKQGKDEDALRIYTYIISRYEKASAASHPDCLAVKNNMAFILGKQGKLDEAMEMLCHVLDGRERLLGPSHVDTLNTKHNVAWVLAEQGKHAEALKLLEEVLELRTKQLGPTHPKTLETNNNIGCLRRVMIAESIAKESLAARQATLPSDHPDNKYTQEIDEISRFRNNPSTHKKLSLWSRLLKYFE